jgi:Flp pilus assembly protein TadD
VALSEEKQSAKAVAVLRKASEHNPYDQNLVGATAVIARDAGRWEEALAAARHLVELFPNQPESHAMLADIENRRAGGPGLAIEAPATGVPVTEAPATQ